LRGVGFVGLQSNHLEPGKVAVDLALSCCRITMLSGLLQSLYD
jgi:hypothetical protein